MGISHFLTVSAALAVFASVQPASAADQTIEIEATTTLEKEPPFHGDRSSVDVAILLDTSNSMDGLIRQAKQQLWMIVQQFAEAQKDGQTPSLRVALFEYGNTALPASEGYIRQAVPLTDDLDSVSEALFSLKTDGGDEYCGQVIDAAVRRLDWSNEPGGYKAIFIAGNEPFTQGSVAYQEACRTAIEKGIVVNTIHCGKHSVGVRGQWQDAAKLAEGKFLNIDQDKVVAHVECPQDKVIIRLNAELNKTYIWFGSKQSRLKYAGNQVAQDSNAKSLAPSALLGRAVVKSGAAYNNSDRDLVDALKVNNRVLDELHDEDLPDALKSLSKEERLARVEEMTAKRRELQERIATLNRERQAFIAKSQASTSSGEATLGDAVTQAIQLQLKDAGFSVQKETGQE